ncbi:MAG: T9SS type A sorting domain-containing protein [bacterium]
MKNPYKLLLLLSFMFMLTCPVYSIIPSYILTAKNITITSSSEFEFDIYLQWSNQGSSDPFYYCSCQYFLNFNTAADDGQIWTVEIIGSELPPGLQPSNTQWDPATTQIRFAGNFPTPGFLVNHVSPGTKILRARITSNSTFNFVPLNLKFRNSGPGLFTKISYFNNNNLGVFITDSTSHYVSGGGINLSNVPQANLIQPADSISGVYLPVTFIWNKILSAATYTLQLSQDSMMNNFVLSDSLLTDTVRTVNALNYNTKYFWRVKVTDTAGLPSHSEIRRFTTREILASPPDNSILSIGPVDFRWEKLFSGDTRYTIKISSDSLFANAVIIDSTTDTFKTVTGLLRNVKYYWKISGEDTSYIPAESEIRSFKKVSDFALIFPSDNDVIYNSNVYFSWRTDLDANAYTLKISTDSLFNVIIYSDTAIADTFKTVSGLPRAQECFWKISFKDAANNTIESEIRSFTRLSNFTLLLPGNNSVNNEVNINFVWRKSEDAFSYILKISEDLFQNNIVYFDSSVTDTFKYVTDFQYDHFYYWSVLVRDVNGNTVDSSEVRNLRTKTLLIYPVANSILEPTASVNFAWHKINNAISYKLDIAADSMMNTIIKSYSSISDTFYNVSDFQVEKKYFWRITDSANVTDGKNGGERDLNSSVVLPVSGFTIKNFLVSPGNNTFVSMGIVSFKWNKVQDATSYILTVASDSLYNSFRNYTVTDTFFVRDSLITNRSYFWKVTGEGNGGKKLTSSGWRFITTPASNIPEYKLSANSFTFIAPNAFEFDITLQHTNPLTSEIFYYGGCQYFFNFNTLIANGGTLSIVKLASDLPLNMQPGNIAIDIPTSQIRLSGNIPSPGYAVSTTLQGTRIVRLRVSTSAQVFANEYLNLSWRNSGTGLITKISYLNSNGLGVFITNPQNHVIDSSQQLPVELSSFISTVTRNNVNLAWATTSELNNSGFEIERSGNEGLWQKVSFMNGAGNSSDIKNYSFEDRNIQSGKYHYRLKQLDYNGNYQYFTLSNEVNVGRPVEFNLSQNYPNPFNPSTKIDYDIPYDGNVSIRVYDLSGKELLTLVNEKKSAGYYSVNFNASDLASGMYFYRISAFDGNTNFVATKKMLLIK